MPIEIFIIPIILIGLVALGLRMWESGSRQTVGQTGRWSKVFLGLLVILVITFLLLFGADWVKWPPFWLEHHRQQQEVLTRVQSAGGWEALKRDAVLLTRQNDNAGFRWLSGKSFLGDGGFTNYALPPAFAALKPSQVRLFNPHRSSQQLGEGPDVEVVEIKIFGMHSTGGHSTPYYGLEVVWGAGTNSYNPRPSHTAIGNAHSSYRKVAEDVYEVY